MEDAALLALILSSHKLGDATIDTRLQKWNEFRYARACTVQAVSMNH
jgi:hypothetical protein